VLSSTPTVVPALLSALHLLTLALGLGAVVWRYRALARVAEGDWREALRADTAWGIAAGLWIATGLARVFAGDKPPVFYTRNVFFWIKMALVAMVFVLELRPMSALLRVRIAARRGSPPPALSLTMLRRISAIEAALIIIIVFVAAFMARGAWML
jgi:putative membrane protein